MLQNKKLADKTLTIHNNFTVFDLLILFLIVTLSIVLSVFTNKFNWKFKFAIFGHKFVKFKSTEIQIWGKNVKN